MVFGIFWSCPSLSHQKFYKSCSSVQAKSSVFIGGCQNWSRMCMRKISQSSTNPLLRFLICPFQQVPFTSYKCDIDRHIFNKLCILMLIFDLSVNPLFILEHSFDLLKIVHSLTDHMSSFRQIDADSYNYFYIFLWCKCFDETKQRFAANLVEMNIEFFLSAYFRILIFDESVWFSLGIKVVSDHLEKGRFAWVPLSHYKDNIFSPIFLISFALVLDLLASVLP